MTEPRTPEQTIREALEFYADDENYRLTLQDAARGRETMVADDGGIRGRAALDNFNSLARELADLRAELAAAREALGEAAHTAKYLHAMIDRETWRENGAEWMGQYEGDKWAEDALRDIERWAALAAAPASPAEAPTADITTLPPPCDDLSYAQGCRCVKCSERERLRNEQHAAQEPQALDIGTGPGQFPGPGLVGVEQSLRQAAEPLNPDHFDRPIGAEAPQAEPASEPQVVPPIIASCFQHGDHLGDECPLCRLRREAASTAEPDTETPAHCTLGCTGPWHMSGCALAGTTRYGSRRADSSGATT